jgi:thiamine-monophosphate kinase
VRSGSERELVEWLRREADAGIGDDCAGIGDDCALLTLAGDYAVTVDAQHEGVHLPAGLDPRLAARRLLAVNLSDLAAMGARPEAAFLSLAAPAGYDRRRFLRALIDACATHGLALRGGDLSSLGSLSATLTLLGRRPSRGRWLTRSAARPGDSLWVGGTLGEAAAGLAVLSLVECSGRGLPRPPSALAARRAAARALRRQLQPEPQLALGLELGRRARVAAIDCSDGLGLDLARLCAASGVGAEVELERLAGPDARLCAELALDPLELALGGGEDYVLLFSLPPRAKPPATPGARSVGRFTERPSVLARDARGRHFDISERGFDHLRRRPAESAAPRQLLRTAGA